MDLFFLFGSIFFSLMTQIFFGLLGVKRDGMVRVRTRLVSRIESGPRLVGRVGSEVRVSDSFHILAVRSRGRDALVRSGLHPHNQNISRLARLPISWQCLLIYYSIA